MSGGFVFNESVTSRPRRFFGLLPRKIVVETTAVPIPTGVSVDDGRGAFDAPGYPATKNVPLTEAELNTIVLALKFGRIRYGMLLQLAGDREQTMLSWDAIGDLRQSLEGILSGADGAT